MFRGRFATLVVKLTSLAAFVGGPLYCCDLLKPKIGDPANFAVCFAPLAIMLLATFAVLEEPPTRVHRIIAGVGILGALGLVGMDAFAAISLLGGATHPNAQMIEFGIVAGVAASAAYCVLALRFMGVGAGAGSGSPAA